MREMENWKLKEKSNYVDGLALEYNKALVAIENEKGAKYLESIREDVAPYKISEEKLQRYKNYKRLIDSILDKMDRNDRTILINDYFYRKNSQWWVEIYSRSSYYRMKRKALDSFLSFFMI